VAGAPGFEPGNGGIKIRCLTTWLRPKCAKRPDHTGVAGRNQMPRGQRLVRHSRPGGSTTEGPSASPIRHDDYSCECPAMAQNGEMRSSELRPAPGSAEHSFLASGLAKRLYRIEPQPPLQIPCYLQGRRLAQRRHPVMRRQSRRLGRALARPNSREHSGCWVSLALDPTYDLKSVPGERASGARPPLYFYCYLQWPPRGLARRAFWQNKASRQKRGTYRR
jgi:hypothetical protein